MDAYSLGQILREAREANDITVEEAVAALRIRQPILEAFEAGEFEIAGVPEIQVRGLLRIYGRFLELDEDEVLRLFDLMRLAQERARRGRRGRRQRRQKTVAERLPSSTQPMHEMQLVERRSSTCGSLLRLLLLLLFSAAALAIIAYVTVELVGIENIISPGPATTATVPTATLTEAPAPRDTIAIAPTASGRAQYSGSGILVSILLTQRSWLSVHVDGLEQFSGIAAPDTLLEYNAVSEVKLAAANAMALDMIWNGQAQGQIGGRGQRADIRFTGSEAIVELGPAGAPTPAPPSEESATEAPPAVTQGPSPKPTETLIPSQTPPPSMTFTPWPTITPLPTATPTPGPPTAVLPPRVTQAGRPPTKEGA